VSRKILEHVLGPVEVSILTKEEARALLRRLHVRPWQIPWIRSSDPLVKAVGAKPGDVLKIVRRSETAGESVIYRLVVPG